MSFLKKIFGGTSDKTEKSEKKSAQTAISPAQIALIEEAMPLVASFFEHQNDPAGAAFCWFRFFEKMVAAGDDFEFLRTPPNELWVWMQKQGLGNFDAKNYPYFFAQRLAENGWAEGEKATFVVQLLRLTIHAGRIESTNSFHNDIVSGHFLNESSGFSDEIACAAAEFLTETILSKPVNFPALDGFGEIIGRTRAELSSRLQRRDWSFLHPIWRDGEARARPLLFKNIGFEVDFEGPAAQLYRQLLAEFRSIYEAQPIEKKSAFEKKAVPSDFPAFQQFLKERADFQAEWLHLMGVLNQTYHQIQGFYYFSPVVFKASLLPSTTLAQLFEQVKIEAFGFKKVPHATIARLAEKRLEKEPLPPEFLAWMQQPEQRTAYQKIIDAALADSKKSGEITAESLENAGFLAYVVDPVLHGGNQYYYQKTQTVFRDFLAWADDVFLLLAQALEVRVLEATKDGELKIQVAPTGEARALEMAAEPFLNGLNGLLSTKNSPYRLVFERKNIGVPRGHYYAEEGWHVRLVPFWAMKKWPKSFRQSPADVLFLENLEPKNDVPLLLSSLTELKKKRTSDKKSSPDDGEKIDATRFGHFVETVVEPLEDAEKVRPLVALVLNYTSGAKPSATFLKKLDEQKTALGAERFASLALFFLDKIYRQELWYEAARLDAMKGFVWALSRVADRRTLAMTRQIIDFAYAKIPGKGPRATGLGDLGFKILQENGSPEAFGQLLILRAKTKYPRFQKQLDKAIERFKNTSALPSGDLEDQTVDDFGLKNGQLETMLGDWAAVLELEDGKARLRWLDAKGKELKAAPESLKKTQPTALKELQLLQKDLQTTFSVQKMRLEAAWLADRKWVFLTWREWIFEHELMRPMAERLLFSFDFSAKTQVGLPEKTGLRTLAGLVEWAEIEAQNPTVRLWHPTESTTETVVGWRDFLIERQIRQPFKQAFREIYLLTEAEVGTRDHSNRFAAHLLKTNNLLALAPQRNWDFKFIYESGDFPKKTVAAFGLRADFDLAGAELGGISPTGRLHFQKTDGGAWVDLIDVPRVVFSEILRDVDLFVAATSIGADPNWNPATEAQSAYWQRYSHGDLSNSTSAEARKRLFEQLLPRTKLAEKARIDGNFLIVKGTLREYKINFGSGNILMAPDDQYLCIVPEPRQREALGQKIWLPFEDDGLTTIILSKAFLLAEDDKIKDSSIVSQIKRR